MIQFETQLPLDFLDNIIVMPLFNHLYSIAYLQIPKVTEWLSKSNYSQLINDKLNEIISKVNDSEQITNSDYRLISFLVLNNLIDEKLKINWLNIIIKGIALKQCYLEQNELDQIVKIYSEELMIKACGVNKSHCKIVDYDEEKNVMENL